MADIKDGDEEQKPPNVAIKVYTCRCGSQDFKIGPHLVVCTKCNGMVHFKEEMPDDIPEKYHEHGVLMPKPEVFNAMMFGQISNMYIEEMTPEQSEAMLRGKSAGAIPKSDKVN